VLRELVGYVFDGSVLGSQQSAPIIRAISLTPRFDHTSLRINGQTVAADLVSAALFHEENFVEDHPERFGNKTVGPIIIESVLGFTVAIPLQHMDSYNRLLFECHSSPFPTCQELMTSRCCCYLRVSAAMWCQVFLT
jgi:hypothetical protein